MLDMRYDIVSGGWRSVCPQSAIREPVLLSQFRRVGRLDGPGRPPVYQIAYRCVQCDDSHRMLLTGTELDLQPVTDPLPPFFNVMTGRLDIAAEFLGGPWAEAMRRGHWPLFLRCPRHREPVRGWPSCLRALEPEVSSGAPRSFLVHFECPRCTQPETQIMTQQQLTLAPPAP